MCISYKCFAFIENILSFISNRHLYELLPSSFKGVIPILSVDIHAMLDYCSMLACMSVCRPPPPPLCARTHTHTNTHTDLVIAHRIYQLDMIWKEVSSMIKILLLDLWRTLPEIHCT
jgi:hypothetical protein